MSETIRRYINLFCHTCIDPIAAIVKTCNICHMAHAKYVAYFILISRSITFSKFDRNQLLSSQWKANRTMGLKKKNELQHFNLYCVHYYRCFATIQPKRYIPLSTRVNYGNKRSFFWYKVIRHSVGNTASAYFDKQTVASHDL